MNKRDNPFVSVIDSFNRSGVRYVIIGGFAGIIHGNNRLTADLDLVTDLGPRSLQLVWDMLLSLGLVLRQPINLEELADPKTRHTFITERNLKAVTFLDPKRPAFAVDLLLDTPINFEDLFSRSIVKPLGEISARLCSLEDLIELKRLAARPRDLLDLEALLLIKERIK